MRNIIKKLYVIYSIIYLVITILSFILLRNVSVPTSIYLIDIVSVFYHFSLLFIFVGFIFLIYCTLKKNRLDALFMFFILLLLVLFTAIITIPLGFVIGGAN